MADLTCGAPSAADSASSVPPERLYGVPFAEHMHFDLATAYETEIEPFRDEQDERLTIEEWSVCPATSHVPTADRLIDWVCDKVSDEGLLDEDGYLSFERAAEKPDVRTAFQTALDLLASKVTYRMADKCLRTYTITWDASGEPLVDGEPMYRQAEPETPKDER